MRLGQIVVDVSPARTSRSFRLLLVCRTIVLLSAGFIAVAVPVQVYRLTDSSLQVGLVSLALGVALIAGFAVGGVLADRMDRRGLILSSSVGVAVSFAVFTANAAIPSDAQLTVIYLVVIIGGMLEGVGETALTAVTPALVERDQLVAGSGLISVTTQLGAIAGPALGGVALAAFDLSGAYGGATAAIVVSTLLLTRLPALPPVPDDDEPEDAEKAGALASIGEALRFVRGNQVIAGVLLIDLFATGFGLPQTLFPQMVDERFHGGPEMVGALAAAPAVGALIASITSGWTGHVRKPGAALIAAVLALGVAYIGFGLSPNLAVALLFLAAVGAVDSISEILRRALLQHHTPDRLQGRVTSLWLAQSSTGYSLGSTTSGIAAGFVGPGLAIIGAGALCVISVAGLAAAAPGLRAATLGVSSTSDPDGVIGGTEEPLGNRQG